jgi:hypothetical protein
MSERALRSAEHRMLHRSRSVAVSVALAVVAVAAVYVGVEAVLAVTGLAPLLIAPGDVAQLLRDDALVRTVAIVVLAVAGLAALVAGVTPGRFHRRRLTDERVRVVIDDEVLAGSASRAAAGAGSVPNDQVVTRLSRRRALVEVRPASGFPIAPSVVTDAVTRDLGRLALRPTPRVAVAVASKGKLS